MICVVCRNPGMIEASGIAIEYILLMKILSYPGHDNSVNKDTFEL